MSRPPFAHHRSSFDGPGARPILGEAGPSGSQHHPDARTTSRGGRDRYGSPQRSYGPPPHPQDSQGYLPYPGPPPVHHPGAGQAYRYSQPPPPLASSVPSKTSPRRHNSPDRQRVSPLTTTAPAPSPPVIKRVGGKANVSSACGPCKRAHLACDVARPCKRCVNMNKEDQCEDVPVSSRISKCGDRGTLHRLMVQHKKRGRPKVNKPPVTEPYTRSRPGEEGGSATGRRGAAPYDPARSYSSSINSPPSPLGDSGRPSSSRMIPSPPRTAIGSMVPVGQVDAAPPLAGPYPPGPASAPPTAHGVQPIPDLFTIFCTTDFNILRITNACHALTGFHSQEFINLNLNRWVHPADQHVLDSERINLLSVSYLQNSLQSTREVTQAIRSHSERELLTPAIGMTEPYPQVNVRLLRADHGYSYYNVRLHLGGGLGGSLWDPELQGNIYLVVSCLLISDRDAPSDRPPSRRAVMGLPPTAISAMPPPPPHTLPSFSSVAASADILPPRDARDMRDPRDLRGDPRDLAPRIVDRPDPREPRDPRSLRSHRDPRDTHDPRDPRDPHRDYRHSQHYYPRQPWPPGPSRRTPSPPPAYPSRYYPPAYYPSYEQVRREDEWRRRSSAAPPPPGPGPVPPGGHHPPPPSGPPGHPGPPGDYRRTWEL